MVNPRRRRRRRSSSRRRGRARRRRNPTLLGRGNIGRTFRDATSLLMGDVAGDVLARIASRFGVGNAIGRMGINPAFGPPLLRIALGLFAAPLLRMLPGKMFGPKFRTDFAAINVANGLIQLSAGMRARAFAAVNLSDYDTAMLMDWETASDGVGDWESADEQVGGYELSDDSYGPPAGVLGESPAHGVLGYY